MVPGDPTHGGGKGGGETEDGTIYTVYIQHIYIFIFIDLSNFIVFI